MLTKTIRVDTLNGPVDVEMDVLYQDNRHLIEYKDSLYILYWYSPKNEFWVKEEDSIDMQWLAIRLLQAKEQTVQLYMRLYIEERDRHKDWERENTSWAM